MKGVLVDTSVWVDHFRKHNDVLVDLLELDLVMMHLLIVGEIACGTPPNRIQMLSDLSSLHQTQHAGIREVMDFNRPRTAIRLGLWFCRSVIACFYVDDTWSPIVDVGSAAVCFGRAVWRDVPACLALILLGSF